METVLDHIGHTPLVRLEHIGRDLPVPVLVKCEHMNPGGSIKDRIALAIVDDAERRGLPVRRYASSDIAAALGPGFELVEQADEEHTTPSGTAQAFAHALCRRSAG